MLDPVQGTFGWEDVVLRIQRRLPRRPSWISERKYLCNSESPCYLMPPVSSYQSSIRSFIWFQRCYLKDFKMDAVAAILVIDTARFGQFRKSQVFLMLLRAIPEKNTWGGKKALFFYPTTQGIQFPPTPTTHVIRKFRTPTTHRIQFS